MSWKVDPELQSWLDASAAFKGHGCCTQCSWFYAFIVTDKAADRTESPPDKPSCTRPPERPGTCRADARAYWRARPKEAEAPALVALAGGRK